MTTTPSRFESSLGNRVVDFLLQLGAATIAAFAIARFGVGNLVPVNDGDLPTATFLVLLLVGVALCTYSFVTSPVTIMVTSSTVDVVKGRILRYSLARDSYGFASPTPGNVLRRRATERILIATNPPQHVEILCRQFSNSTFEKLIEELQRF